MTSGRSRASATSDGGLDPIRQEPAFVLHYWLWKESSLLLDLLTRDHGRVVVIARGARRPGSAFRGMTEPFAPIAVTTTGAQDVRILKSVAWLGGIAPLRGEALFSGFYLNELVMRGVAREDPTRGLFGAYFQAIRGLSDGQGEAALRRFEVAFLEVTGYGVSVPEDADWVVREDEHLVGCGADAPGALPAALARKIFSGDFSDPAAKRAAKGLLRAILDYHAGRPPVSRLIAKEIQTMARRPSGS